MCVSVAASLCILSLAYRYLCVFVWFQTNKNIWRVHSAERSGLVLKGKDKRHVEKNKRTHISLAFGWVDCDLVDGCTPALLCLYMCVCVKKRVCSQWYKVNKSIAIAIRETITAGFHVGHTPTHIHMHSPHTHPPTHTYAHTHTHCATCPGYWSSFRSKLYKVFLKERAAEDERWKRVEGEVHKEFVNDERGVERIHRGLRETQRAEVEDP